STAQIYYNDVKVPVENLIGKPGMGFRIALSILHMGRIKLGANVIGAAKKTVSDSVKYANERKQFGVLISSFGAIKFKLAEQAIRTFALESSIYRASNDIDDLMKEYKESGMDKGLASIEAISHYAVEAALLKVFGSEVLDYVTDEAVQIHGGMGYSAEMAVERGYRDSRINRIFEGTNEINRLLLVETAIKRGMKGDFDLASVAESYYNDFKNCRTNKKDRETFFEQQLRYIGNFKKAALILIHAVQQKFGKDMLREQEVINNISNIMIQTYTSESLALRIKKISDNGLKQNLDIYKDMLAVYVYDAAGIVAKNAIDAVCSTEEGDKGVELYQYIKKLVCVEGVNVKDARRRIADYIIEENEYKF
ncbi:MAG TPA: acyl-CoA dehydrogenase family protein, partial [Bacteroidales bacterium]|nr:acyl-CoA dehydrogenase family protein [Bacteroidales bacterium]